jgi:dihydrodipicolinate synthase/N-acetylneuraminate lyase
MPNLSGTVIPLPTPFDEREEVDEEVFRQIIEFEVNAKVDGIMVAGSYGQGPVMRSDQRMRVAQIAVNQVNGRVPVVVHVGAPDVQTVVTLGQHSDKTGASALLIVPPYYYTDHSEYEITEHYKAVTRAVSLPIYIYNNKRYAGIDITPEYARRLVEVVPSICGVKLAWGTAQETAGYVDALKGFDFGVFPGTATESIAAANVGARGTLAPLASLFPELCVDLWNAAINKQEERALVLQERAKRLNGVLSECVKKVGRTAFKEFYRIRGINMTLYPRWPAQQLNDEERANLRAKVAEAGWPPTSD